MFTVPFTTRYFHRKTIQVWAIRSGNFKITTSSAASTHNIEKNSFRTSLQPLIGTQTHTLSCEDEFLSLEMGYNSYVTLPPLLREHMLKVPHKHGNSFEDLIIERGKVRETITPKK